MRIRKLLKKLLTYPSFPDFYILGAQKAGTTSLDSYLKQHPDFQATYPKEIHFFDNKEVYKNGIQWYKNHFRRFYFGRKKLFFESTPNYLFNKDLPEFLWSAKPDLKFIVILRDPIDRAYSAFNMFKNNYLQQKKEEKQIQEHLLKYEKNGGFMSFEEAIEKELKMIEDGTDNEIFDESFTFIRKGIYEKQLQNWYRYFPKKQFLILQFEDLKKDEIALLNQIADFLGVKNFNSLKIDKELRNKREYEEKISESTQKLLAEFYSKY